MEAWKRTLFVACHTELSWITLLCYLNKSTLFYQRPSHLDRRSYILQLWHHAKVLVQGSRRASVFWEYRSWSWCNNSDRTKRRQFCITFIFEHSHSYVCVRLQRYFCLANAQNMQWNKCLENLSLPSRCWQDFEISRRIQDFHYRTRRDVNPHVMLYVPYVGCVNYCAFTFIEFQKAAYRMMTWRQY